MIDPREFTDEMEKYWSEKLRNVPSEALRKVWFQLAKVFGRYAIGETHRNEWTVLQPPTGSGKTQGTIVYCSMLSRINKDLREDFIPEETLPNLLWELIRRPLPFSGLSGLPDWLLQPPLSNFFRGNNSWLEKCEPWRC